MIPDHPVIHNMENTGYPDKKVPQYPICPACGAESNIFFRDVNLDICGCNECISTVDAWEVIKDER